MWVPLLVYARPAGFIVLEPWSRGFVSSQNAAMTIAKSSLLAGDSGQLGRLRELARIGRRKCFASRPPFFSGTLAIGEKGGGTLIEGARPWGTAKSRRFSN